MRSAALSAIVLLLAACSSTSGSPPLDRAPALPDAGPFSAGDVLFPDAPPPDRSRADAGSPADTTPPEDQLRPDLTPPDQALPPDAFAVSLSVGAAQVLGWKTCASTPAESPPLGAGTYSVTLTASSLSKGTHKDDYLLIGLPVAPGSADERFRFVVLNGVGATQAFTLASPGVVRAWFLDSDHSNNTGTGTATVAPGAHALTVAGNSNVIAWLQDCKTSPAEVEVPAGTHRLTLKASTYASAPGLSDAYVVIRLPLEGDESNKFISLNGVGDSKVVTLPAFGLVRAWLLAESTGSQSGQVTITVTAP